MAKRTFNIIAADGKKLFACFWEVGPEPIAIIAIIHGLDDHIERYEYLAKFLNKNKIAVIGMDYQGHGKSPGKRGHVRSYDLLLSNVESLLIKARSDYNDVPLFVYGHSLGGNIVANYVLRHQSKELSGAILSSPFFELAFAPPKWKTTLAKVFGRIWPSLTLDDEIDPMELSHDPLVGKNYLEDPLVQGKVSARLYNSATARGSWALQNAHLLNYPVFIMHGDEDRLTAHQASIRFAENAGASVTLKIWKGLRHELHNETNKDEVLKYICDWIKQNIKK